MSPKFNWVDATRWLVLALGIGLTQLSYRYVSTETADDARSNFEEACREVQRAIESRLTIYSGLLLGLRGLHAAQGGFSRRLFRDYVSSLGLDERYRAIQYLNYAQEMSGVERLRFEKQVAAEPEAASGFKVMAPPRERHHVLLYLEPRERFPHLIGRDLRITRSTPQLFDELGHSGDFVSTGEVVPGVEGLPLALRLGIYKAGLAAHGGERWADGFIGSVGIGFSLVELFKEAVTTRSLHALRIRMHRVGRVGQEAPFAKATEHNLLIDTATLALFRDAAALPLELPGQDLFHSLRLAHGGAVLELSFSAPTSAFASPIRQVLPAIVLVVGLILSLLLFGFVNSLTRHRRQLAAAIVRRTLDLQTLNRLLQQEVAERNQLEREIFHLHVEERQRFGKELHENIGQQLTAIGFLLESLAGDLEHRWPSEHELASRVGEHVSTAIAHTRLLAQGLNPVAVEAGGFALALQRLAADTRDTFQIDCALVREGEAPRRDPVLEHNLYRITQQAVTNAITHGRATRIRIEFSNDAGRLRLAIIDNGVGFARTRARPASGIGLQIMRYRCSVLGLRLRIESERRGGGAAIIIERLHLNE